MVSNFSIRALVPRLRSAWIAWWPVPVSGSLLLTAQGTHADRLIVFLTVTVLWPAVFFARQLWGERFGLALATTFAVLLLWRAWLPPVTFETQPALLARPFRSRDDVVKHTIGLDVGQGARSQLLAEPSKNETYLYILVGALAVVTETHLQVTVNGSHQWPLTLQTRVVQSEIRADAHRHEWHRLPLSRAVLEEGPTLHVEVTPDPLGPEPIGTVGIIGGYSYRPTAQSASQFHTANAWTSDPLALFPQTDMAISVDNSYVGRVRYFIELRVVDAATKRLRAIYY